LELKKNFDRVGKIASLKKNYKFVISLKVNAIKTLLFCCGSGVETDALSPPSPGLKSDITLDSAAAE